MEVLKKNSTSVDAPIKQVTIITSRNRFDVLKTGMAPIGVTGMTVTEVVGCGVQKGVTELYRGFPVDITIHPKV